MKIGLMPANLGTTDINAVCGLASGAEALGYESVWTFEHVMMPIDYESKYPYEESGKMGIPPEMPFVDPLIALSAIAARTKTIRLGTGVNILTQSNPLYLAKQAASLDALSNGRLSLGVGVGWLREEFVAMGVPFERRGARFDDYVQAMRKVWSGETVEHQSDFLNWTGFKSYPLPAQDPLPIIIGGNKGRTFERIAKYADGWYLPASGVDLVPALAELRQACETVDRDFSEIEVTMGWLGRGGVEAVGELAEAGVHRLVVPLQVLGKNPAEGMQKLSEEVINAL